MQNYGYQQYRRRSRWFSDQNTRSPAATDFHVKRLSGHCKTVSKYPLCDAGAYASAPAEKLELELLPALAAIIGVVVVIGTVAGAGLRLTDTHLLRLPHRSLSPGPSSCFASGFSA
jgi:hypothetical protein